MSMVEPTVGAQLSVELAYSPEPRVVHVCQVSLPRGSCVRDALRAGDLLSKFPSLDVDGMALSVWGRKVSLDQLLRDHDRIELCRPLLVDPKVARRERFVRQGSRSAGLFAQRRPGAKAGY